MTLCYPSDRHNDWLEPSQTLLCMDLSAELESMAFNAADDCDVEYEPAEEEITIWQTLFTYS